MVGELIAPRQMPLWVGVRRSSPWVLHSSPLGVRRTSMGSSAMGFGFWGVSFKVEGGGTGGVGVLSF